MTQPPRHPHALPLGVLLAAHLLVFWRFLVPGASGSPGLILLYDFHDAFYPWMAYAGDVIRSGHWPLWNPYHGAGTPFFINPGHLLYAPLTLPMALAFGFTHHVVQVHSFLLLLIGGVGAYAFAFSLWGSRAGALLAALSFSLSSVVWGNLQHTTIVYIAILAPWFFWCLRMVLCRQSPWAPLGLTIVLYTLAVAAYPIFLLILAASGLFWSLFLLSRRSDALRERLLAFGTAALSAFWALGLSAIHWLPIAWHFQEFTRSKPLTPAMALANGVDFHHLLGLVYSIMPWHTVPGDPLDVSMRGLYIGALALPLVGVALFCRRDGWTIAFSLLSVAMLALAMGSNLFVRPWLHDLFPVLNYARFPSGDTRYLMALGLALLAGRGLATLSGASDSARRVAFIGLVGLLGLLLAGFVVLPPLLGVEVFAGAPRLFLLFQVILTLLALLVIAGWSRLGDLPARAALILLLVLDLGLAFKVNIRVVGGEPANYAAIRALHRHDFPVAAAEVPRLYGCKGTIVEDHLCTPANAGHLSKTFYLGQYNPQRFVRLHRLVDGGLKNWLLDGARVVQWQQAELPASSRAFLAGSKPVTFTLLAYGPNEVRYRVHADQPTWLIFNELYFSGWRAQMGERDVAMSAAIEGLRAVRVEAGTHDVRTYFAPRSFAVALAVSLAFLVGLLLWAAWLLGRGRRRRRPQG